MAHRLASLLRLNLLVAKLADHPVRVLVAHGRLRRRELWVCRLTEADVYSHLRQRGQGRLQDVGYRLYEPKGGLTLVPEVSGPHGDLIRAGLEDAADWPDREAKVRGSG